MTNDKQWQPALEDTFGITTIGVENLDSWKSILNMKRLEILPSNTIQKIVCSH